MVAKSRTGVIMWEVSKNGFVVGKCKDQINVLANDHAITGRHLLIGNTVCKRADASSSNREAVAHKQKPEYQYTTMAIPFHTNGTKPTEVHSSEAWSTTLVLMLGQCLPCEGSRLAADSETPPKAAAYKQLQI